jgi:hypothetical protein
LYIPMGSSCAAAEAFCALAVMWRWEMADRWQEFRVSNDARNDAQELRRRMAEDGYVFFRRLVNPDAMMSLRADIMRVLQNAGWLVPGADPLLGIADLSKRCTEGDSSYGPVYHQVYRLESFHRLPHDPDLVTTVEELMDARTIPVPGHKARIWFPRFLQHTTPTHQDFVHYQGSVHAITCWTPVGDCPIELGPLAVLPRSHTVNKILPHHFSLGAGGLIIQVEDHTQRYPQLETPWRSTNFDVGDVLFFPALTIHRALPNLTEDRLRVSLDNRYQKEGDTIAAHMLQPHLSDLSPITWEEVYKDWKSSEYKYYWRAMRHRVVPRYMRYIEGGFAEAVDRARSRDEHAILALRRTIQLNNSAADVQTARKVLQEIGVGE